MASLIETNGARNAGNRREIKVPMLALRLNDRFGVNPQAFHAVTDFGADVDSSGVDGQTALIHAARRDNASFAMLLHFAFKYVHPACKAKYLFFT